MENKKHKETLEAKLRNQLTPLYSLAQMVLLIDKHPDMKKLIISTANKAVKSRKKIDSLLVKIEEQHEKNKPKR